MVKYYEGLPANDFLLNYAASLTIITEGIILRPKFQFSLIGQFSLRVSSGW